MASKCSWNASAMSSIEGTELIFHPRPVAHQGCWWIPRAHELHIHALIARISEQCTTSSPVVRGILLLAAWQAVSSSLSKDTTLPRTTQLFRQQDAAQDRPPQFSQGAATSDCWDWKLNMRISLGLEGKRDKITLGDARPVL